MNSSFTLILEEEAKNQLDEIFGYIVKNFSSERTARKINLEINNTLLVLENHPYLGRKIDETYRRLPLTKTYIAIYRVDKDLKKVIVEWIVSGKTDYILNIKEKNNV